MQTMMILTQRSILMVVQLQHPLPPVSCSTELFMVARIIVSKGMRSIGKFHRDF